MEKVEEGDSVTKLVNSFDNFLFDCDGVLWNGGTLIPGAGEALNLLRKLGKKVFFITNNNTRTREENLMKLKKLNIEARTEEIVCAAHVLAWYLKEELNFKGKAYVVGSTGVSQELESFGINFIRMEKDVFPDSFTIFNDFDLHLDPEVNCVIAAFDSQLSFKKLMIATSYLRERKDNCLFVVSNLDALWPMNGRALPGSGSIVTSVISAAKRQPIVIGKPGEPMFKFLQKTHNLDRNRCLMFGDRLDTDIEFARINGFSSVLVSTGIHQYEDGMQCLKSDSEEEQRKTPHFYMESVGAMNKYKL